MTRIQALMLLIEAVNPITNRDLQIATGWPRRTVDGALRALESYGVVVRCYNKRSRVCYRPS
jgi:hypothetical protein